MASTEALGTHTFTAWRHHEDGCWWATSPQAPNWTAAANSPDELFRLVSEAPGFLFDWEDGYSVALIDSGSWTVTF